MQGYFFSVPMLLNSEGHADPDRLPEKSSSESTGEDEKSESKKPSAPSITLVKHDEENEKQD